MKNRFNRYCAVVMGLIVVPSEYSDEHIFVKNATSCLEWYYNPYDDLNQMAEVIEKLLDDANIFIENQIYPNKYMITRDGFKQTFRDFIISTMQN